MRSPESLPRIDATLPVLDPPAWAVLQRQLFATLSQSVQPFLDKYTHPDGTLIWRDALPGRDGADDFYESSYNWPLLYLLGGTDDLLPLAIRQWEAITRQVTALKPLGQIHKEYERGYDWFHQGESNLYFYFLCLADPQRAIHRERARRFAGFYLNEDPDAPNYDAERKLIRAPHTGSAGPRYGFSDSPEPRYGWSAGMARYGLPFPDVPGIAHYDDLKDPDLARRMGAAMHDRMGRGDLTTVSIHHWQQHNPVLTEALIQLTLGAPAPVYNGGLLHAPLRYFDAQRRRPGLPKDVAALVTRVTAEEVAVHLVNLNPVSARELVIQAGTFAEHRFDEAHYEVAAEPAAYPGPVAYAPPTPSTETRHVPVNSPHVLIHFPPTTEIQLTLTTSRFASLPTYDQPIQTH